MRLKNGTYLLNALLIVIFTLSACKEKDEEEVLTKGLEYDEMTGLKLNISGINHPESSQIYSCRSGSNGHLAIAGQTADGNTGLSKSVLTLVTVDKGQTCYRYMDVNSHFDIHHLDLEEDINLIYSNYSLVDGSNPGIAVNSNFTCSPENEINYSSDLNELDVSAPEKIILYSSWRNGRLHLFGRYVTVRNNIYYRGIWILVYSKEGNLLTSKIHEIYESYAVYETPEGYNILSIMNNDTQNPYLTRIDNELDIVDGPKNVNVAFDWYRDDFYGKNGEMYSVERLSQQVFTIKTYNIQGIEINNNFVHNPISTVDIGGFPQIIGHSNSGGMMVAFTGDFQTEKLALVELDSKGDVIKNKLFDDLNVVFNQVFFIEQIDNGDILVVGTYLERGLNVNPIKSKIGVLRLRW